MTLEPLLNAPGVVQAHAVAALAAPGLGCTQLLLPKGTTVHRLTGYTWVPVMLVVAISSFRVHSIRLIGPFSPIHRLSIMTLAGVPRAVILARRGDSAGHRRMMAMLFWLALVSAGLFTLLPGRIMGAVVPGG